MRNNKKNKGLDDILLSQSNEKKVEFMHSIGMTHDNAQEILNMGDILMQSGYSKEAYDLFNRASSMGNAQASTRKGESLMVGNGCGVDPKAALKAFEQSAGQGDPWGTIAAAFIYHCGMGIERNEKKAEKYLSTVINNNLLTSQLSNTDTKQQII